MSTAETASDLITMGLEKEKDIEVQNIILVPGPIHLFWTDVAYYLWELAKKYNVILLVDENYSDSAEFQKLVEVTDTLGVVYIPPMNTFRKHWFYGITFKQILLKYQPKYVFHHDAVYVSMMYLNYHGSKCPSPPVRISYGTGMSPNNWEKDARACVSYSINALMKRHDIPKWCAKILLKIKSMLFLILNYYILPLIFIKNYFSPPLDIMCFKILKDYWNDHFDYYLVYDDIDKKVVSQLFGSEDGVQEICHPLRTIGEELNSILYDVEGGNYALILPTYAYVVDYKVRNNISDQEFIKNISSKWITAIKALKAKFLNYSFFWKLHPAMVQDELWQKVQEAIKEDIPDLSLLLFTENAQKWIVKSKIIVGDCSAALWWASLIPSKISISLDIFGAPFMDSFKDRNRIYYFTDIDDIHKTDFSVGIKRFSNSNKYVPTLTEFLNTL